VKTNNLKPWQPGVSGNPKGRPRGSRSIKKGVTNLLNSPKTYNLLSRDTLRDTGTPLEAIVCTLIIKAIRGDVRAADVLLKHSADTDELAEPGGFFSKEKLVIEIVEPDGKSYLYSDRPIVIDDKTGQVAEISN